LIKPELISRVVFVIIAPRLFSGEAQMIDQKPIVGHIVLGIAGLLLACMVPHAATAQDCTATTQPGTPPDASDLACAIRQQFGAVYSNGVLGNDWCFNVETERGYSWWYYNVAAPLPNGAPDPAGLMATQITHTARIQGTYIPTGAGSPNFRSYASVFLGLDATAANLPPFSYTVLVKPMTSSSTTLEPKAETSIKRALLPDPNVLQVPGAPYSNCQSFGDFLRAYAWPYTLMLGPTWVAPTMDIGSGGKYANARYWMFNGRGHVVLNVGSYPITLVDPSNNNKAYNVKLVVGFGGGAGP
jgi:hypothetical protein